MNAPLLQPNVGRPDVCALDLTITRGDDGRSRLKQRHASFPWSLGRGYPGKAGEPVKLIPQMAGAGLLAGDHVTQRVQIGAGSALHLASAGAMLTYGSPNGNRSTSEWSIELAPSARAFVVSEPYVLLDGANLRLRQVLTVAPNATFIGCEGIVCAQPGNGIQWQAETVARRPDGGHLFTDRQRANPDVLPLQAEMEADWTAFGTILVLSPSVELIMHAIDESACIPIGAVWMAMSPTRADSGICIRIAAKNGQQLRTAMLNMVAAMIETCHRA